MRGRIPHISAPPKDPNPNKTCDFLPLSAVIWAHIAWDEASITLSYLLAGVVSYVKDQMIRLRYLLEEQSLEAVRNMIF